MRNLLIAIVATAVIVGGGAFYGGMQYGKQSATSSWGRGGNFRNLSPEDRQQHMGQLGGMGMPTGNGARVGVRGGGDVVSGEVLAKDATSMTVKIRDGGSKIVVFSGTTEVGKFVVGAIDDVLVGTNVIVMGKANADGSVTAQSIQIRPPESPARARKP